MTWQVWYQGAYASRLNMESHDFNSILMDRGDRVSIQVLKLPQPGSVPDLVCPVWRVKSRPFRNSLVCQGDGHPTMAAALTAFGREAFPLVATMLNATDSGSAHGHHVVDDSIMAYAPHPNPTPILPPWGDVACPAHAISLGET